MPMLPSAVGGSPQVLGIAKVALSFTLILHLLIVAAEFMMPHATDNAAYAARLITHGPFKNLFWGGALGLGGVLPLCFLWAPFGFGVAVAGVLTMIGLLFFEWCFVMAGQSVPNS